jgi:poly(A) polymerase
MNKPSSSASGISTQQISSNALKVIQRLENEGFAAYLVGGGVRDILLGGTPKDFDISTDARPEQIRQLFRNSRIIGRRFRIVHVVFGREVIEVTTFRGHHPSADDDDAPEQPTEGNRYSRVSDSGRLLRDNIYGSLEEDALRRDFTVNALYYTPSSDTILDYCNGQQDLQDRRLRLIGDPETRYREDPVRMLRAVRFCAKLDFTMDPAVVGPFKQLAPLLHDIPAARMFDEVLKLFMSGAAVATYQQLQKHHLFGFLFPATQRILQHNNPVYDRFIESMLHNTDLRIQQDKPVTPAFLYGALLWPAVQQQTHALEKQGEASIPAQQQAGIASIEHQLQYTSIPRRFSTPMREIWALQSRLQNPRDPEQLLGLARFRAAYDFLLLREQSGEETGGLADWWTRYQEANEEQRTELRGQLQLSSPGKKRKPRRRRSPRRKISDQAP